MAIVIADIALITDPNWLILAPLMEIYYAQQNTTAASVAVGAAAISAIASLYIQSKYDTLANNYYKLYKAQRDFYYSNFQNNPSGELGLINQVFNNPLAGNGQAGTSYTPQYITQASTVETFNSALGAFSGDDPSGITTGTHVDWWTIHANFYNDIPYNYQRDPRGFVVSGGEPQFIDERTTVVDFINYLYRYEEHRKDVYDERTWEWQNQALNTGVKQASVVQSGLATSFQFLDDAFGNMSDWFATQANGLAMQAGYKSTFTNTSERLAASTQAGRALSISPNLGNDIRMRRVPDPARTDVDQYLLEGPRRGLT